MLAVSQLESAETLHIIYIIYKMLNCDNSRQMDQHLKDRLSLPKPLSPLEPVDERNALRPSMV